MPGHFHGNDSITSLAIPSCQKYKGKQTDGLLNFEEGFSFLILYHSLIFVSKLLPIMSALRLPTLKYQYGENTDEISSQSVEKSKGQQCCTLKTSHNTEESFDKPETTDVCEDESMLEALDSLSDHELDELLNKALAINKQLKQRLKDESLSGKLKDQGRIQDSSRTRNTVVLPPIVKKDCAMSTRLRANR